MAVVTLNCIADTGTVNADPSGNYNWREDIFVSGGAQVGYAWMRFDASSLPSDFSWDNVSTATLRLIFKAIDSPSERFNLYFKKPEGGWSENTLTWDNDPPLSGIKKSFTNKYIPNSVGSPVEFTFTGDEIQEFIRGSYVELVMGMEYYDPYRVLWFYSREVAGKEPKLTLTYTPTCPAVTFSREPAVTPDPPTEGEDITCACFPRYASGKKNQTITLYVYNLDRKETYFYDTIPATSRTVPLPIGCAGNKILIQFSVAQLCSNNVWSDWTDSSTFVYPETKQKKLTSVICYDITASEGQNYGPAARLTEGVYPYSPIPNKLLDFYINGVYYCSGMTNSNGEAFCDPGAGAPSAADSYTILAKWGGDDDYEASSGSGTLTIEPGMCTQTIEVRTADGSAINATLEYGDGELQSFNTPFTRTHDYKEGKTYTVTASTSAYGWSSVSRTFVACTGSKITLTLAREAGFIVNVSSVPSGGVTVNCIGGLLKIPLTDYYLIPGSFISAEKFCSSPSCTITFSEADGLVNGLKYTILPELGTLPFKHGLWVHQDGVWELSDTPQTINISGSYAPPDWMKTLCGFFNVSDTDCFTNFINAVPDLLFSAEDLSIILRHKSIYPPYEAKTPTKLNYLFALLALAPLGGMVKDVGKAGTKAVKVAKMSDVVKSFIKDATFPSAREPGKEIKFLQVMYDLKPEHLSEVLEKLDVGDINAADTLIRQYLPEGRLPAECVKDLKAHLHAILGQFPKNEAEALIREAGLKGVIGNEAWAAIGMKPPIGGDTVARVDDLLRNVPDAKESIANKIKDIVTTPASTADETEKVANAAENYGEVVEKAGEKILLEDVESVINNVVGDIGYVKGEGVIERVFRNSLKKALSGPSPVALTAPQCEGIIKTVRLHPDSAAKAFAKMSDADMIKYLKSLKLSGSKGEEAAANVAGARATALCVNAFEKEGRSLKEVMDALTVSGTKTPDAWIEMGKKAMDEADKGKLIDDLATEYADDFIEEVSEKVGKEVADTAVQDIVMTDAIRQCIKRKEITSKELNDLARLYDKHPKSADNALKSLTPEELAKITELLEETGKGRSVENLWGFRDELRQRFGDQTGDDVLEFWIKETGKVVHRADDLKSYILRHWKKMALLGGTPVIGLYFMFEASQNKQGMVGLGILPTPIYQRWDAVYWNADKAMKLLERDPNDEEGRRLARENLKEMDYLITYVEEHPIPEDKARKMVEAARGMWGEGIGSANEETLKSMRNARDVYKKTYYELTGDYIIPELPAEFTAYVVERVDGDTIRITSSEIPPLEGGDELTVRVLGIDAIEGKSPHNKEPYQITRQTDKKGEDGDIEIWFPPTNADGKALYDEALRDLTTLCYGNVTIKTDPANQVDRYNRVLGAVINSSGVNVGREMLKKGYAALRLYAPNTVVDDEYLLYYAAEDYAKTRNLGIWQWYGDRGNIKCISNPETAANVYVDGEYRGQTKSYELLVLGVKVGEHTVKFSKIVGGVTYECEVTVTVEKDSTVEATCVMQPVGPGPCPSPTARFSISPGTTVNVGETITVNASASDAGDGHTISEYCFDFGDGSTNSSMIATHVYTEPGSYPIVLTVTNDCGEDDDTTRTITVHDVPPPPPPEGCSLSTDKPSYTVGEEGLITYADAPSDGVLKSIKPDGTTKNVWPVSGSDTRTERFNEEGNWTITLTGTDCTKSLTVPVSSAAPTTATYKINDVTYAGVVVPNFQVWVDGQYTHHYTPETLTFGPGKLCSEPEYDVKCELGKHTIELKKEGYPTWSETLTLKAGDSIERDPVLGEPAPTPTDVCSYIEYLGGAASIGMFDVLDVLGAYKGDTDIGFAPGMFDVMGVIAYYKNDYAGGDNLTGCTGLYRLVNALKRIR